MAPVSFASTTKNDTDLEALRALPPAERVRADITMKFESTLEAFEKFGAAAILARCIEGAVGARNGSVKVEVQAMSQLVLHVWGMYVTYRVVFFRRCERVQSL